MKQGSCIGEHHGNLAAAGSARVRGGRTVTRARWVAATQPSTPTPAISITGESDSPSTSAAELTDARDAAARQARVPGEEAEEHRHDRLVAEAEPGDRVGVGRRDDGHHSRYRNCERQR
jgi:hypothetical protein